MTGFITTPEAAAAILDAIRVASLAHTGAAPWSPGAFPIYSGDHAGMMFIPADEGILSTPLRNHPEPTTPKSYPEFEQIIAMLGGLESRVEIEPEQIRNPDVAED